MKQKATPHPPSRGFTLVEVIVVLGIIIGLSTVVFGYVQSAQTSSEVSRLMRDADFVRSAVVSYGQQHNGNYNGLIFTKGAGTNLLVSVGLLPSRFRITTDGNNSYEGGEENPFGTLWFIGGADGYNIGAGAHDTQAASSLFNKWSDENGGDGDCTIEADGKFLGCSFTN